jgi:hypothetical protein
MFLTITVVLREYQTLSYNKIPCQYVFELFLPEIYDNSSLAVLCDNLDLKIQTRLTTTSNQLHLHYALQDLYQKMTLRP